ncbi:MAG: N-acetylmuramoyl-L-alanine amidase, partial [Candidatus Cloacimonetes bacterium]|nr:N-acetylmuramoyl-L-alanine amidase [Candidatus Cloacimonadota bacterium]
DSIGISLIGKRDFSQEQLNVIRQFVIDLMFSYNISIDNIYGHYEMQSGKLQKKTCPNIDMHWFRNEIRKEMGQTYGKSI